MNYQDLKKKQGQDTCPYVDNVTKKNIIYIFMVIHNIKIFNLRFVLKNTLSVKVAME